jgi:hypothetical protein
MKPDPTSLDALRDIALPPLVPWWPLAPGWYLLIGLLFLAAVVGGWRIWRRWQANAYRREALRALAALDPHDLGGHAELVRRTALAEAPRSSVAPLNGRAWIDYLVRTCPSLGPERWAWLDDVYRDRGPSPSTAAATVRQWITKHHVAEAEPC